MTRRDPLSGLPPIQDSVSSALKELEIFEKQEIAEAFGVERWQITRDAKALWGEEVCYQPLTRTQGWMLYAVACFRRIQYLVMNRGCVRNEEIVEFANWPESRINQLISAAGGSRHDYDSRMDQISLRRRIKRLT